MPNPVHHLFFIPLSIGAIASLKSFRLAWPWPFRVFSIFLIGTLIMEIFALTWKVWIHKTQWWTFSKANYWIYNIYYIPEYLFYFWFFYKVLLPGTFKKYHWIALSTLFILGSFINLFCGQGIFSLSNYTLVPGNLCVLFLSLMYFRQEMLSVQPIRIVSDPLFWICLGAFIFHTGTLPYFIFFNKVVKTNEALAKALFYILLILNIFMQTTYLIAFLCRSPFRKKST